MSIHKLKAIAEQVLSVATAVPYSAGITEGASPADEVRSANEGLEKLLSAAIGYALPLPTEVVGSPKLWFGEQYGQSVGTLVSLIGELRILNPELIAMNAQGVWLYRYAQTFSLSSLIQFGQLNSGVVAGISCLEAYCRDRQIANAAMPLMAIEQMGKLVMDFHVDLAKETADA